MEVGRGRWDDGGGTDVSREERSGRRRLVYLTVAQRNWRYEGEECDNCRTIVGTIFYALKSCLKK